LGERESEDIFRGAPMKKAERRKWCREEEKECQLTGGCEALRGGSGGSRGSVIIG